MADFKPLIVVLLILFVIGIFLNVFIVPFTNADDPNPDSVLYGTINLIENGISINDNTMWCAIVPLLCVIHVRPINILWFGIDWITDFIVDDLTALSYIPNIIIAPFMIIFTLALILSIIAIFRGN
jgi:hypothetical protein